MSVKHRLFFAAIVLWICVIVRCLGSGSGVFFSQMSHGTTELYSLDVSTMSKNMAVNGECSMVYDCVASYVTEETSKYTGKTTETTNAYYYVIPIDEEYCMLLKTSARSDLTDKADAQVDLFWDDNSTIDDLYDASFRVDGILTKNDDEIVGFYNEWVEYFDDDEGLSLAPYTLDCTKTVSTRIKEFWVGSILLIAFIGAGVFVLVKYISGKRPYPYQNVPAYVSSSPSVYGDTYGSNSSGSASGEFQAQGSSQNTYGQQNGFVTQGSSSQSGYLGNSSYGSSVPTMTNDYRSQGSSQNTYGQQNGFVTQGSGSQSGYSGNSSYGSSIPTMTNDYRSQGSSQNTYGQQNGFVTQGGNYGNRYDPTLTYGGSDQRRSDDFQTQGNGYGDGVGTNSDGGNPYDNAF